MQITLVDRLCIFRNERERTGRYCGVFLTVLMSFQEACHPAQMAHCFTVLLTVQYVAHFAQLITYKVRTLQDISFNCTYDLKISFPHKLMHIYAKGDS